MYGSAGKNKGQPQVSKLVASSQDPAKKRQLMAAAAEARMKALQAATQAQQLWSVTPDTVLSHCFA